MNQQTTIRQNTFSQQIRAWLAPPVFPDDELKTHRAAILNIMLFVDLAFVTSTTVSYFLGGRLPVEFLGINAMAFAAFLSGLFLLRTGRVQLVSYILFGVSTFLITLGILQLGTIRTPTTSILLVMIVAAGLLFDLRLMIVQIILNSLIVFGAIWAENAGLLPTPDYVVNISQWITYTALSLFAGLLTFLGIQSAKRARDRAFNAVKELERAQDALRTSEARYRFISENTADVIWVMDPLTQQFTFISPSVTKLRGYTPQEIMGQPVRDALTPESYTLVTQTLTEHLARFMQGGDPRMSFVSEIDQPRRDGSVVNTEVTTTFVLNAQEQVQLIGVSRDITERKRAERALRENAERYRQAIIAADAIPYELEYATNRYTFIGEGLAKLTGYAPEGSNFATIVPLESVLQGDLKDMEFYEALQSIRGGTLNTPWKCDYRLRTPDGREVWISDSAVQIRDEAGNLTGSIGILQDITERKTAERLLQERVKEATAQVHDLYNNAPCGYHSLNTEGHYVFVNDTELKWLGRERHQVIGHSFAEFLAPDQVEYFNAVDLRTVRTQGTIRELEFDMMRQDGSVFTVLLSADAICDDAGNFVMTRATLVDITARKQAEQQLRQTNRELERASRLKDEFLANMSHELRTPLNAILGLSQTLGEQLIGPLNPRQRDGVAMIQSGGEHLLDLINDILDLAKIQSGNLQLDPCPVQVAAVCESGLSLVKQTAQKKQIKIQSFVDTSAAWVLADTRALKQILVNLLSNAVKFTPSGGQVKLAVNGDEPNALIRFSVQDTGIGIAPEDLARLFTPFTQVDSSMTRRYEGTGLGLALVKRLVEMHDGSISVESVPGKGSTFTVTLPWDPAMQNYSQFLAQAAARPALTPFAAQNADNAARPEGPLILIAEDNEGNTTMLSVYLQAKGYRLDFAQHGGMVLERVHAQRPALILMDIQMPVLDGLEATQQLRRNPDPTIANIPIIALTALAMPTDRERALAAGANAYISKPIDFTQLMSLVQQFTKSDDA